MLKHIVLTGSALALATSVSASVIDGTTSGDAYGAPRAIQTVETQFGDNFSELNAAYGVLGGGQLDLALTGNLEGNFNKLHILIDSAAGGFNVFPALPGNDGVGVYAGMTFDAGFEPDYHLILRRGNDSGNDKFDVDFARLGTGLFTSQFDIMGGQTGIGTVNPGPANASSIQVAYDNSNVAGVLGGTGPANQPAAAAVLTGVELSIALSDLGYAGSGDIKVMAFVAGGDHRYLSNQFLGGLAAPQSNLGSDGFGNYIGAGAIGGNFNFNNYAGAQCFTVPEPATLSVLALSGLALLRRRS
jgi:hypothetical protein